MSIMTFKTSIIVISSSSCFTHGRVGAHMELLMLTDMSNMTKSNHHSMTHVTIMIIFIWCDNFEIENSIQSLLFDSIMKKMITTCYNSHVFNFYS